MVLAGAPWPTDIPGDYRIVNCLNRSRRCAQCVSGSGAVAYVRRPVRAHTLRGCRQPRLCAMRSPRAALTLRTQVLLQQHLGPCAQPPTQGLLSPLITPISGGAPFI